MTRSRALRPLSRIVVSAGLIAALAAPAHADDTRVRRIESIRTARAMVSDKLEDRRSDLHRALARSYRLLRPRRARRWVESQAVSRRTWVRGWIKTLLRIKRAEHDALAGELELLDAALAEALRDIADPGSLIGDLVPPVDGAIAQGYGPYRHPSGATLFRHGVAFQADEGEPVRAPMSGTIRYVGPIRGLGPGVIFESDGGALCVLAGVRTRVTSGASVVAGEPVGTVQGAHVHMEIRSHSRGRGSIDPRPHLRGR